MIAVYDVGLFPLSLGDVLSWCVRTSVAAVKAGERQVDVWICAGPKQPVFAYQRDMLSAANMDLHLAELIGAFNAHPMLGDLRIYRDRDRLLLDLGLDDPGYRSALFLSEDDRLEFFNRSIFSYARINEHFRRTRSVPMLTPRCDVQSLLAAWGGRVVAVHPRLRRLDVEMAGRFSYDRDSDLGVWIDFFRRAPSDIRFVVLGRLQEKPLQMLRAPNVFSLRPLGLGLGHEIALIQAADLFIGASSGFAVAANFSSTPYYICGATAATWAGYGIKPGERLPWATPIQQIVTVGPSDAMLDGLANVAPRPVREAPGRWFLDDAEVGRETRYLKEVERLMAWRRMEPALLRRLRIGVSRRLGLA